MTLILFALAWMIGIVIADGRAADTPALLLLALGAGALAALLRRGADLRLNRLRLSLAMLLLSAALLGAWRSMMARPVTSAASVWRWLDQPVVLEMVVAEEPRWTEVEQRVVLEAQARWLEGRAVPAEGRVLAVLPPEPARLPGERLLIEGTLAAPPAGRGFDYAGYLARRGIFAVFKQPVIRRAAPPPFSLRVVLLELKGHAHHAILRLLPEPESSLLSGILLGLQSSLPREVYEEFNRSGTSHILVISGWNISITIAGALWVACRLGLRRWLAALLALGAVGLYVALVGPTATVVRSALMGALVALASPLHRRSDPWTALAFACLAMSAIDPYVLWDLGFQLSAGAVAGLFACGGSLNQRFGRLLAPRYLRWAAEPLAATLAAQIFTLPLLLYHFGRLSLIAPLANVVLLPAVPMAMGLGALATLAELLLWPLGRLLAFPAWLPLAWLTRGAHLFAWLPFASVPIPTFPPWLLFAYYALVSAILLHTRSNSRSDAV